MRTDAAVLASQPTLAKWQRSHAADKLELAHYATFNDPYEVDFRRLDRWCAASVSRSPEQIRTALFYVPSVKRGALPPLPEKASATLTRTCRMQAIWYETHAQISLDVVVHELSSFWGKPNGQSAEPDIRGSGDWKGIFAWHRAGMNIWVVNDSVLRSDTIRGPRLVVYMRRDIPPDLEAGAPLLGSAIKTQVADASARIAALDSKLTAAMLSRSHCETGRPRSEAGTLTTGRLARWFRVSRDLPPQRRAAALLLADFYIACNEIPTKSLLKLGAGFRTMCPQDGPFYSHNFRDRAEKLDAKGPAGELAGLASLADPCYLKGTRPWQDLVIEEGEKLLSEFPPDNWTPWFHYAIARAHDAKLALVYPGGDPEEQGFHLSRAGMQRERDAAIEHFKLFLQEKPDAAESVYAWQEAWRLLAGLPPSPIRFGCGCE